jgi:acyl-CoA reductase-like NAD-dependent aldehyde dehydrogenase
MTLDSISFTTFFNIVGGQPRSSSSSENNTHGVDPSNGRALWDVPVAVSYDLDDAVTAAQEAFVTWSGALWSQRQTCLTNLRDILLEHAEEMTELIMKEGGKPVCALLSDAYKC